MVHAEVMWRTVEQESRLLVFRDMRLVAAVPKRRPNAREDAEAIRQFPALVDCGFCLLSGARRASVEAADMSRMLELLAAFPAPTPGPWRIRRNSLLAVAHRRLWCIARVPRPALAVALASIPAILDALRFLSDSREAAPIYLASPHAIRSLAREYRPLPAMLAAADLPVRGGAAFPPRFPPVRAAPARPGVAGRGRGSETGAPG